MQNRRGVMWRVRWRFTIVRRFVQKRRNRWARRSSRDEARRICGGSIRKSVVASISRSCTTSIPAGTQTTLCKCEESLSFLSFFFNSRNRRWKFGFFLSLLFFEVFSNLSYFFGGKEIMKLWKWKKAKRNAFLNFAHYSRCIFSDKIIF